MTIKRPYAVADCETLPFKKGRKILEAYIWEFWDGVTRFYTYDTAEFVEYLRDYDGIVYAHNGGKFDWHFLLPYLDAYEDIMLINGRIAKVMLGKCQLRDSYNIIPVPLAAYKKDDFDYTILEVDQRKRGDNPAKIRKYLHSDCVNLYELVDRFIRDFGLHLTFAGASMKQWVKLSDRAAPKTEEEFYEEFSPFYYGGRVECFESGIIEGNFAKYDINSAYPKAMMEEHPYSGNYVKHDGFKADADFYTVRCLSDGAFPYRQGGLTFPSDSVVREYYVTRWEYYAALDTATISRVKVLQSIKFVDRTDFSVYINHFAKLRFDCKEKGDAAGALFGKFFMNSLYGKFAANPDNYKTHMIVPMDVTGGLERAGWGFAGELGPWGLAEQPLPEERRRYYNVATGASITGYVRAMLWRAICASDRVLYCDTDAITCAKGNGMEFGEALGQWKHEGDYDRIGIGGKKLYIMRGAAGWWENAEGKVVHTTKKPDGGTRLYSIASKGAKLTHAQLWRVAAGGVVTYESESPTFSAKKPQSFVKRKIRNTAKVVDNCI